MSVAKRPRTGGVISMSTGSSFGSLSERASTLIEDIMTTGERGLRRKGSKLMLLHAECVIRIQHPPILIFTAV